MKTIRCILFVLVLALLAIECKKDSGPSESGGTGPLTEQEKQAIVQTYQNIAATADTILLGENPIAGFQRNLAAYRAYANVENAWTDNNTMYVAFKRAGFVQWHVPPDVTIPPYDGPITPPIAVLSSSARLSGGVNTRVCLINTWDQDESRTVCRDYFAFLKRKFENSGFQVTIVNGAAANVQFFKTGLKQFGVIILYAHGKHTDATGRSWLQTGELGTVLGLNAVYPNEFQAKQIDLVDVPETRGGQRVETPYYVVSDNFIRSSYVAGDFPGTVIYLGSCQVLKYVPMSQAFVAGGAAAVIGWTESNSIGPAAARRLFGFLLCGKSLQDAILSLPYEEKNDRYANGVLAYYPPQAGTLRLVADVRRATLNIIGPQPDSEHPTRTINLEGNLSSSGTIDLGTAELNAVGLRLSLLSDRRSFFQQIGIKSGTNNIRITGLVDVPGGCACIDNPYTFRGTFNPLDLWAVLRWNTDNTDVDFHLLRPGANFPGDLWTSSDCYYSNRTTSWGAFLDVDNTSGRGPEHITIPTVSIQGEYKLCVHYYASHGVQGVTYADVDVSVRGDPNETFRGLGLSNSASRGGDVWEVCTITYPAGTVTRVMTKTRLPGLDGGASIAGGEKK